MHFKALNVKATNKSIKTQVHKTAIFACLFAASVLVLSCKKENTPPVSKPVAYNSIYDFYSKNNPLSQYYQINASTGGSFTSPQGTKVIISPYSFVDLNNNLIFGEISIEFKDIYKKSDMLMAHVPTMLGDGTPLLSGGEFFFRAGQDTLDLNLAYKKSIVVQQPSNGKDSTMQPFIIDSLTNAWIPMPADILNNGAGSYVFDLFLNGSNQFGTGTWCNSDDPGYFSAYKKTTLTIYPGFSMVDFIRSMDVYLVFKGLNTVVQVYPNGYQVFPFTYTYAPQGLECTVVAVGVKEGNLWASFTPITISANQSVTIPISQIATTDFKSKLTALDN